MSPLFLSFPLSVLHPGGTRSRPPSIYTCVMSQESATVTVRLVKSFEYKNCRNIVLHQVDLTTTTLRHLETTIRDRIAANPVLTRLFATVSLDTFKLYYHPHCAKTNNPIINVGSDEELVLCDYDRPLSTLGFQHETEVSFFEAQSYAAYRDNPQFKW